MKSQFFIFSPKSNASCSSFADLVMELIIYIDFFLTLS